MASKIQVSFNLTGIGIDPDKITSAIGILPDKTWRLGDEIQKTLLKRKHDGWSISTGIQESDDLNKQVQKILERVKPNIPKIKEICDELKLDSEFDCTIYLDEENIPAIHFEKSTLEIIYLLNSEIDIDIIPI